MSETEEKKRSLRKKMKRLRDEFVARKEETGELAAVLSALVGNFFSLPETREKKSFFIYNAFGSEAGTMPVIDRLLREGKEVYLPRVEGSDMVAVRYHAAAPLQRGTYGIFEPTGTAYDGETDVVVLPLLAADKEGNRLGYGGGFYDRFLKTRRGIKIGYCYDFQLSDEPLETEPHDQKADILVTDKRVVRIQKK